MENPGLSASHVRSLVTDRNYAQRGYATNTAIKDMKLVSVGWTIQEGRRTEVRKVYCAE